MIFVIIEAINVTHSIVKSIVDTISTRSLIKAQNDALNGQQKAIKIQDEQLKLTKFYSERQNEQNENIKHLAFLITDHSSRLNEIEKNLPKITTKKAVIKKTKENK